MIRLTRLNGRSFFLNAELIENIETTPDTVITLTNGRTYMVREPVDLVRKRVINYRRLIFYRLPQIRSRRPPEMPAA